MGCDGGTIPRRDELVKVKKKPEQVNLYQTAFPGIIQVYFINFLPNNGSLMRSKNSFDFCS